MISLAGEGHVPWFVQDYRFQTVGFMGIRDALQDTSNGDDPLTDFQDPLCMVTILDRFPRADTINPRPGTRHHTNGSFPF
jgi:hypothetical protein